MLIGPRAAPQVSIVDEVAIEIDAGGAWRCAAALAAETAELLDLFLPLVAAGPWVIAQLGQSLDGRIATETGASHYINALEARTHLHRLRARWSMRWWWVWAR